MDNFKLPAYPLPLVNNSDGEVKDASDWNGSNTGFTKLELASLMIAQGMAYAKTPNQYGWLAKECVDIAKAVLEEANK